jgi:antitoxin VapB
MSISIAFTNNRSQAVRTTSDKLHVAQSWDSFFLNGPALSDDFMIERASQEQGERESLNDLVSTRHQQRSLF